MKNTVRFLIAASLFVAGSAFAKGGSAQTHHCQLNGAEVAKTHKECTKAGGKWEKGAPAGGTAAAPAPAAPAPAPAPTPAPAPAK